MICLSWNRENGTSAIDTVCLAGPVQDYETLVACLVPSHENTSRNINTSCLAVRS